MSMMLLRAAENAKVGICPLQLVIYFSYLGTSRASNCENSGDSTFYTERSAITLMIHGNGLTSERSNGRYRIIYSIYFPEPC